MGLLVCAGAQMMCSFGAAPSALVVLPVKKTLASGPPTATIQDMQPMTNIPPFAMCMSLANPTVAAATAAALGVLTPMPCIPVPVGPWKPGAAKTLIGGVPALDNTCTLNCAYGGVITFLNPGQTKSTVG